MLHLANGSKYKGQFIGEGDVSGELVFQTGMVGYMEALTDPSYAGQILVFSFPMVGNYGVSEEMMESAKIQVRGVVLYDLHSDELLNVLKACGVPVLMGVNCRDLVLELREVGTMLAWMGNTEMSVPPQTEWYNPALKNLVSEVSCSDTYQFGDGMKEKTVYVVDC